MGYDELKNLSHEDLNLFEERLTAFFKLSVEDSFTQLRQQLENRFRRYRFSNPDELVDATISRLIRKVVELERQGEPILDLKAFALRIAGFIAREFERARKKNVPLNSDATPDPETPVRPREPRFHPDAGIHAIEKEIEIDCMKACLEELSADKRALLIEYYPPDTVNAQDKKELREQIAIREAGGTLEAASGASQRQVNNLQAKISKMRSKLSNCLDKCWDTKRSIDTRLVFLEAQQAGE